MVTVYKKTIICPVDVVQAACVINTARPRTVDYVVRHVRPNEALKSSNFYAQPSLFVSKAQ